MKLAVKLIVALNLAAITALVFIYADLMVSPGKLIREHQVFEKNCFACHSVFSGASSEKCTSCHKADGIGLVTTKGVPVPVPKTAVPFHQNLVEDDCIACHSDHDGVAKYRTEHAFTHELVDRTTRELCTNCHASPKDGLHLALLQECRQCHGTDAWKPATFDHRQYFVFDRDHDAECTTCHTTASYKEYTCYGCHEHSEREVRGEHLEEGIRNFENCTDCHRSANEDEAERAWRSIRRGVPYEFGLPSGTSGRDREEDRDDDDD